MLSVKAENNKRLKPEMQLKMRHLQAVRPDGNAPQPLQRNRLLQFCYGIFLPKDKVSLIGTASVIVRGTVGEYRYIRARTSLRLTYSRHDSHIGKVICAVPLLRWLSKTVRFIRDEKCLPLF
jgi:hypothetical protein